MCLEVNHPGNVNSVSETFSSKCCAKYSLLKSLLSNDSQVAQMFMF